MKEPAVRSRVSSWIYISYVKRAAYINPRVMVSQDYSSIVPNADGACASLQPEINLEN